MRRLRRPAVALIVLLIATLAPDAVAAGAPPARVPGEVLVGYRSDAPPAARDDARDQVAAQGSGFLAGPDNERLEVPAGTVDSALRALRDDPAVRYAEPNYVVRAAQGPLEPRFRSQWALRNTGQITFGPRGAAGADLGVEAAWQRTVGRPSVTVAVLDTGIGRDHPDLNVPLVIGDDFVDGGVPFDRHGHGTHVAGIIGAAHNGAGIAGIAPGVRLLPLRVLDQFGTGSVAGVANAMIAARGRGADIINLSLDVPPSQAMDDAMARVADVLVVAAAGNGLRGAGRDLDDRNATSLCNTTFENLLCVAATDARDRLSAFSNYGRWSVDLAAPGEHILSTQPHVETLIRDSFETPTEGRWYPSGPGNDWRRMPVRAFSDTYTMGSTRASGPVEGGYVPVDSTMTSLATWDLAGRAPCRLSASADLSGNETLTLEVTGTRDEAGLRGIPSVSWSDAGRSFRQTEFSGRLIGARVSWHLVRGERPGHANLDDVWFRCLRTDWRADGYDFLSGTSMAAPMAAGVAALRMSLYPGESPAEVRRALVAGAEPRPGLAGKVLSGGRLDAAAAIAPPLPEPPPPPSGTISTLLGPADGLVAPADVEAASDGSLMIAEYEHEQVARVRRLAPGGALLHVAGTGAPGFSGDGGPATEARIATTQVEALPGGGFLLNESPTNRVRRVSPDGTITTVAGNGTTGRVTDGAVATASPLPDYFHVVALPDGGFLLASYHDGIARVTPDGMIRAQEGLCLVDPCVPALTDAARGPGEIVLAVGDSSARVYRLAPGQAPRVVAGTLPGVFGGDGGPASQAGFAQIGGVTALPDGGFVVSDTRAHRVRRVLPDGTVWTVAGVALPGDRGDGGPAVRARLTSPTAITAMNGGVAVIERTRGRIRFIELPG